MELTIKQVIKELNLQVFTVANTLNNTVNGAYVSDLLSDVMGNSKQGDIWITLQTHKNVVAIASLRDLPAVIFVNGLIPEPETIEAANAEDITLLGTKEKTFEISGKLYNLICR
jgi:serine kinase of HPr protein (carbohydrate metabolism regulator)